MLCILCRSESEGCIVSQKLYSGRSTNPDYLKMLEKYDVRRCEKCGHTQLYPLPTQEEDKEFYEADTHTKEMHNGDIMRQKLQRDTKRRAGLLADHVGLTTVLDFGCGFGHFVGELSKRGYEATGADISSSRLKLAKKWNEGEFVLFDPDHNFEDQFNKYDVVCAFHVLEHLRDPVKSLKQMYDLVNPNGYLIIEVPNAGDPMLKLLPSYNDFFWQRIHLSYFDAWHLELTAFRAGCASVEIKFTQRYGLENLIHWAHNGGPEPGDPTFTTSNPALVEAEKIYKRHREESKTADTLIAIIHKSNQ